MKVYMGTDLEGVAGVVSFYEQTYDDGRYNDQARHLLTAEINAAIDGLVQAGVEDVLVWDGHGSGGIVFKELHDQARLLHGRPMAPRSMIDPIIAGYDVCMIIGQHAMAGTVEGNLAHTQSSRTIDYYTLNGHPIGEIAQFALYQGALGLPMIFMSGDDAACREAKALIPGITTVAVKVSLSRHSAISLSAAESKRRIYEGIQKALARHQAEPIAPLHWDGPYVLEKRYFNTDLADRAAAQPGIERIDAKTVRICGDKIKDVIYR